MQDGRTIDGVEGILDVNEKHDLVRVVAVSVHQLSSSMNNTFSPVRSSNSNLDGLEHSLDLASHEFERDFAREPAEGFANRDRPVRGGLARRLPKLGAQTVQPILTVARDSDDLAGGVVTIASGGSTKSQGKHGEEFDPRAFVAMSTWMRRLLQRSLAPTGIEVRSLPWEVETSDRPGAPSMSGRPTERGAGADAAVKAR